MNNQTIEIIDSSQMNVLSDFRYVDEPINNIEHYYLGLLGEKFMTRMRDLEGNIRGKVFFDRSNFAEVIGKMENVYDGKLKELKEVDYFSVKKGKDDIIIGITSTFPHTSFAPLEKFKLINNRRAELDNLNFGSWDLYMSIETGRKMLQEMERIAPQVL